MKLTIDVNEYTNKKLVGELEKKGLILVTEDLGVGDFFVPPNHVIERKEYSDFISSAKNRGGLRIFEQLSRMKKMQKNGYNVTLLIEGIEETAILKKSQRTNLSYKAAFNQMQGLKLSIATEYQIPILMSPSMSVTAYMLKRMIEKSGSESKPLPLRSSIPASRPMSEKQRYILEGFPFIGPKTAENIMKAYPYLLRFFLECDNRPDRVAKEVKRLNKNIPYEVRDILRYNGG